MQITRSISNCNSHYAATCFELCHMSNQCISTCVCLWKIPDIKNVILTRHNIVNPRKPAPNSIHFSSFFVYVQSPGLLSVKIPVWADVSRRVEGVCYCRLGEKKKKKKMKQHVRLVNSGVVLQWNWHTVRERKRQGGGGEGPHKCQTTSLDTRWILSLWFIARMALIILFN